MASKAYGYAIQQNPRTRALSACFLLENVPAERSLPFTST